MKSVVLSALYLFIALFALRADSPPSKYSGTASVGGLGTIVLPAGEWVLEFHRIQPPEADILRRDYFTFKRVDGDLERITIFRYRPGYPHPIRNMLDSIGETMGDGIPPEEEPNKTGQELHALSTEPRAPTPEDKYITFSFIAVQKPPSRAWLCHSFLFLRESYTFVFTHSSQFVIKPDTVQDVGSSLRFSPKTQESPNK